MTLNQSLQLINLSFEVGKATSDKNFQMFATPNPLHLRCQGKVLKITSNKVKKGLIRILQTTDYGSAFPGVVNPGDTVQVTFSSTLKKLPKKGDIIFSTVEGKRMPGDIIQYTIVEFRYPKIQNLKK